MKRGFKASARRLAKEVREELGLDDKDPFAPEAWAELYGIPLLGLDELQCNKQTRQHFLGPSSASWSAALVPNGNGQIIVYNSAHAPVRIKSDVSHEAGHVLLEHPNVVSVTGVQGCRNVERELEDQANELAGELLLPASAAHRLARRRVSDQEVALMYLNQHPDGTLASGFHRGTNCGPAPARGLSTIRWSLGRQPDFATGSALGLCGTSWGQPPGPRQAPARSFTGDTETPPYGQAHRLSHRAS